MPAVAWLLCMASQLPIATLNALGAVYLFVTSLPSGTGHNGHCEAAPGCRVVCSHVAGSSGASSTAMQPVHLYVGWEHVARAVQGAAEGLPAPPSL